MRTILVIGVLVVGAYFAYRWLENRNSSGTGLGSNLDSATPELVAGSSGPDSGLNYYAGNTNVTLPPVDITYTGLTPVDKPKIISPLPRSPVRNPVERPG